MDVSDACLLLIKSSYLPHLGSQMGGELSWGRDPSSPSKSDGYFAQRK